MLGVIMLMLQFGYSIDAGRASCSESEWQCLLADGCAVGRLCVEVDPICWARSLRQQSNVKYLQMEDQHLAKQSSLIFPDEIANRDVTLGSFHGCGNKPLGILS
ncbi:hypothetical protein CABS01_12242 [Colletotrichum abscissum]|uniref:uncharacterized protein n=1 Tax=Colletotrichum abscissum TaxID=1671311 RepID=UPI0027D6E70E|nr:uncharacterized protein CABS01_12242 [Colletotrichum abscissum]KAK1491149.1 hypothetical protein CABS01_12242 [Colletotrichum abscissum]